MWLEDRAPAEEPLLNDKVANEALPIEEVGGLPPRARRPSLALSRARRTRPPDKLILSSYVKPLEWSRPGRTRRHLIRKFPDCSSRNATLSIREILRSCTCAISTLTSSASRWWLVRRSTTFPFPATWIRGPISVWRKTRCISAIMTSMKRSSWYGPTSNF